jgi:lambda family phage portal protein
MAENDRSVPRIRMIGEDAETGKVRLRVPVGFDYRHYRNLDMPGQAQVILPLTSGKSEAAHRDKAVRAIRDLDRNNEVVRGGLDRKSNTVVGANLRVNPMPDWRALGQDARWGMEFSQAAASAFADWATDDRALCDTEGHYQFGGLMWQGFRTLVGPDAEIAGVIHFEEERREEYNTRWGTHVQLIDPDRISNPDGSADSGTLFRGRELDRHGRMIGLHIRREHPADSSNDPRAGSHEYVARETAWGRPMAFHWFFKRRAGMQRALSSLVTSLRHIRMLDKFDDATLQNAAVNAVLATYIKTTMTPEQTAAHLAPAYDEESEGYVSEFDRKLDHYEEMDLVIGNQRVPVLGPNDEIAMARMANAVPGAEEFRNSFLRYFASALNVSFEQLSLDYSRSNYSSTRASLIEAWRSVTFERFMFTNHVARLIYSAVLEEAFAIGWFDDLISGLPDFYDARSAYTACSWTGPGMGWVDPLKEANAAGVRKSGLFSTLEQENAAQGNNWRDTLDQQAIERAYAEELGIAYEGTVPGEPAADPDAEEETNTEPDARDERENQEAQS